MIKPAEVIKTRGPKHIEIEIFSSCQLQCVTCGRWRNNNKSYSMPFAKIKALIEEFAKIGVDSVIISGGEPTLHECFNETLRLISERKIDLVIFTNGYCNEISVWDSMVEYANTIVVSLDGPSPEVHDNIRGRHGSFNRAKELIQYILFQRNQRKGKDFPQIGINHTISSANTQYIKEMVMVAKSMSVDYIRLSPAYGLSIKHHTEDSVRNLRENLINASASWNDGVYLSSHAELLKCNEINSVDFIQGRPIHRLLKKHPVNCYICNSFMLIDTNGDVYPCTSCRYSNDSDQNAKSARIQYKMGNVFTDGLLHVWNGTMYNDFRDQLQSNKPQNYPEACGGCPFYIDFRQIEKELSLYAVKLSDKLYEFSIED
jgi:radical SAM protein with 4Fe4S-binding SPASM domain